MPTKEKQEAAGRERVSCLSVISSDRWWNGLDGQRWADAEGEKSTPDQTSGHLCWRTRPRSLTNAADDAARFEAGTIATRDVTALCTQNEPRGRGGSAGSLLRLGRAGGVAWLSHPSPSSLQTHDAKNTSRLRDFSLALLSRLLRRSALDIYIASNSTSMVDNCYCCTCHEVVCEIVASLGQGRRYSSTSAVGSEEGQELPALSVQCSSATDERARYFHLPLRLSLFLPGGASNALEPSALGGILP